MREHLRAGTRERVTGRNHHSKDIEGYIGEPGWQMHGMKYLGKDKKGVVKEHEHGITDDLIDGEDHEILLERQARARASIESSNPRGVFQRMSPEYRRPPSGG